MNGQTMLIGNLSDRQQLLFCIAGTPALVGRIFNGDYAGFRVPVVVRPKSPFYHPGIQLPAVADQGPQLYGREVGSRTGFIIERDRKSTRLNSSHVAISY